MVHIGRLVEVGLGKESTRQTAVSIAQWMPKTSVDFDDTGENIVDETSIGVINDAANEHISQRMANGGIEAYARNESIAYPLLSLLSSVSSSQIGSSGVYTHTFTEGQNNKNQSLTIGVKDPVQGKEFAGAVINSMTISGESGGFITISMDFMSLQGSDKSYSPSYGTEYPFLTKHVTFKTGSALNSLTTRNIRSFEINFEKNVEPEPKVGSIDPADFYNTQFTVTGSLTAVYENETDYKNKSLDGTYQALRMTAEDTNTDIGSGNYPLLEFSLPRCWFEEWSASRDNDSIVTQEVSFKGLYDTGKGYAVQAKLQNNTTSY